MDAMIRILASPPSEVMKVTARPLAALSAIDCAGGAPFPCRVLRAAQRGASACPPLPGPALSPPVCVNALQVRANLKRVRERLNFRTLQLLQAMLHLPPPPEAELPMQQQQHQHQH